MYLVIVTMDCHHELSIYYKYTILWLITSMHLVHCNLFRINGLSSSVNIEFLHISVMANPLAVLKFISKTKSISWCLSDVILFKQFTLNSLPQFKGELNYLGLCTGGDWCILWCIVPNSINKLCICSHIILWLFLLWILCLQIFMIMQKKKKNREATFFFFFNYI